VQAFEFGLAQANHTQSLVSSQVIDGVITLLFLLPESEVLLEELDDALGVTEVVLLELVDLVESLLESGISEFASLGVILEDLVVEDGEVEGESELDGVAGGKINSIGFLVGDLGLTLNFVELSILGVLGNVAVVVTDHLDEESLGLISAVAVEDAVLDDINDLLAVVDELSLDLGLVGEEIIVELGVLRVLLDGGNSAACGTLGRNEVLESDRKKVTLVRVDGATLDNEDFLKEINHVFEAFSLLGDTGQENFLFDVCHLKVL